MSMASPAYFTECHLHSEQIFCQEHALTSMQEACFHMSCSYSAENALLCICHDPSVSFLDFVFVV